MIILNVAILFQNPMEKAQKFKEMGNKYFNDGKYDEAILQYSKAIETCLKGNPSELSIFYQNRAAAYTKLVYILNIFIRPFKLFA